MGEYIRPCPAAIPTDIQFAGAQNETDEMAAKEEESNAVNDQEQSEKPTSEGQKDEQEETKDVDGEELDAMENVNEINLDDADSDHEENVEQHQVVLSDACRTKF